MFSQFLLDSERDLQRKRRDRVHQECADGLVDAEARHTLADRRCVLAVLTLAGVDGPELVTALLVADAHRHTHATDLVNAGLSLATIRKRLGHRNLQTTLRYAEQSDPVADAEMRAWRRRTDQRLRATRQRTQGD